CGVAVLLDVLGYCEHDEVMRLSPKERKFKSWHRARRLREEMGRSSDTPRNWTGDSGVIYPEVPFKEGSGSSGRSTRS
ncbi:hypothetical protein MetMK1DRAFT_00024250, partial [Metallosphaera yellowstonensis MK1]